MRQYCVNKGQAIPNLVRSPHPSTPAWCSCSAIWSSCCLSRCCSAAASARRPSFSAASACSCFTSRCNCSCWCLLLAISAG